MKVSAVVPRTTIAAEVRSARATTVTSAIPSTQMIGLLITFPRSSTVCCFLLTSVEVANAQHNHASACSQPVPLERAVTPAI